jgi:D-alanine-D-alanine ligase
MRAQALALDVHVLLGLRDWSRTDLIVDADGVPWFLEVNVAPGMTETSLFPQALVAAELPLGALTSELVSAAISRG